MKKTSADNRDDAIMVNVEQLMEKLNCGYKTAREIGEHAEARICVGRRVWYNIAKIQKYLEEIAV